MTYLNNNTIDLRRFFATVIRYKWIYIATAVVLMTGSIYFALTREAKYTLNAVLLVENEGDTGGRLSGMGAMLGLSVPSMFGGTSLENEMVVMQSNAVYERAIKDLQLNRQYFLYKGLMNKQTLYNESPLRLVAADDIYFDTVSAGMQFKIKLKPNGTADVKVVRGFFNTLFEQNDMALPTTIKVDGMDFSLLTTKHYVKGEPMEMRIAVTNNNTAINELSKSLSIIAFDKVSDAMLLIHTDPNLQRGKDVLNTLITAYFDQRTLDKGQKASRGLDVINQQIDSAYVNLIKSESQLERFRIENNITDISTELEISLNATATLDADMMASRTQIIICDLLLKFLRSEDSKYSLLPISDDKGTQAGMSIANQYNELVIQRMKLLRSAKPDNAALTEVTASIDALRDAVIASVEQQKHNLSSSIAEQEKKYSEFTSRLGSTPRLQREYTDLSRRLQLNNQVYLFLLNKKTEYEMQQASSELPATIVDKAYCPENEASNTSSIIFPMIGIFLSLLFPSMFVLYKLWREQAIEHEYDMPLTVKHNGMPTYETTAMLRAALLAHNQSRLIPITFDDEHIDGNRQRAVADLAKQIADTGRRIIAIDLNNIYGCSDCQLNGDLDSPKAATLGGIDLLAYDGTPSDILLNNRFKAMVASLAERYDSIMLLCKNDNEAIDALTNITDDETPTVVMVERGQAKRSRVAQIAKAHIGIKFMFWIY